MNNNTKEEDKQRQVTLFLCVTISNTTNNKWKKHHHYNHKKKNETVKQANNRTNKRYIFVKIFHQHHPNQPFVQTSLTRNLLSNYRIPVIFVVWGCCQKQKKNFLLCSPKFPIFYIIVIRSIHFTWIFKPTNRMLEII